MKNTQKGSVATTILVVIVIIIFLIGIYYFLNKKQINENTSNTTTATSTNIESKSDTKNEEVYTFSEFIEPNQNMEYFLRKLSDTEYELEVNGFQTMLKIKAYTQTKGQDSMDLIFDSYKEKSVPDIFKKGDVLLTFTVGDSDDTLIVLNWNKLKPIDLNNKTAIFIKK